MERLFLPLHPTRYADLLGKKINQHQVNVWLINTGWTGGGYGEGERIKLAYTRAMITAVLKGDLEEVNYVKHPIFGFEMPETCPNVPSELLNPCATWNGAEAYDHAALYLADLFRSNFAKYSDYASPQILAGAPLV